MSQRTNSQQKPFLLLTSARAHCGDFSRLVCSKAKHLLEGGAPAGHQRGCPGPGGWCMMEAKPPRRAGCAPASAAARCEKTHARTLAAPWQAAWKMPALADTVSKEDSFQNLKQSSGGCPRGRGPAPTSPSAGTSRQQRAAAPGSKHSRHSPGKHFARLLRLWLLFLQETVQPTNK